MPAGALAGRAAAGQCGGAKGLSFMSADQFRDADRDLAEDALRELVAAIALGDYRDAGGGRLVEALAFLKARAVLELGETLRAPKRRRD